MTQDGWVVLASETGVIEVPADEVAVQGPAAPRQAVPGRPRARRDRARTRRSRRSWRARRPYGKWLADRVVHIEDLPEKTPRVPRVEPLRAKQLAFGWTEEDLRVTLVPMARDGAEPTGSMGNDAALAVLSDMRPPLFSYFKQLFAQVTNPAIDPIRESIVMSLEAVIGPEINLLDETPDHCHQLVMPQPLLRSTELEKLRQVDHSVFEARTIDMTWPAAEGAQGMERRLEEMCAEASELVERGVNIIVLSDRNLGAERVAMPALLATAAVHHHLVREGTRLQSGLVVETGQAKEIHHVACLIGYGASAVNPYVMFESLYALHREGAPARGHGPGRGRARSTIKAIGKGLLKILSKMGISTIRSYTGAQIFEAIGLEQELVDRHFTGTPSRVGGVGLNVLAWECLDRHARAYPRGQLRAAPRRAASTPGAATASSTAGTRRRSRRSSRRRASEDGARGLRALRHLRERGGGAEVGAARPAALHRAGRARAAGRGRARGRDREALQVRRHVARRALAGGPRDAGRRHEPPRREIEHRRGRRGPGALRATTRRSSIKQVASGRFGVTVHYLVNADELQIKVAQGAKPGEGGQLPGHKVDRYIARLRHSTPGVGLISPPPHHDIYSIEDLKQLIYDLRCANPRARVSVKLVSEVGVGTVAAGVAKANADHVVIAGHDGGTGASPQASIQHAGIPWEIGLAETQQTLLRNDLRSRILVEVDGQMRTGRDVVDRRHPRRRRVRLLDRPADRARLHHDARLPPEHLPGRRGDPGPGAARALRGPARARRELPVHGRRGGARDHGAARHAHDEELIGRTDLLEPDQATDHWKARGIDLRALLAVPDTSSRSAAPLRARARTRALRLDQRGPAPALPPRPRGGPARSARAPRSRTRTARSAACSPARSRACTATPGCPTGSCTSR